MDKKRQEELIANMTKNLAMLRTRLGYSQGALAERVGVSRSTIANIENQRSPMTWNMFLSLILLFTKNKETDVLLNVLNIYTDELNDFIKGREGQN